MSAADSAAWTPWLEHAARIAWRGHGNVEPNPMVGCVLISAHGEFVAEGYHRSLGKAHAEVEALTRAGAAARGGTAIVTLEPCNHHGRTGPCSRALIQAGIARVVYACSDPHPRASGGADYLRAHGVSVIQVSCAAAEQVTAPFLHTVRTGMPWVCIKLAQTHDGRISTHPGESRWISGARSRATVHTERGRVDAILTGMGTVLADDPLLTVRGVRARRVPMRVVWDPRLQIPLESQLVRTVAEAPLVVATTVAEAEWSSAQHTHAAALRAAGAGILTVPSLRTLLSTLHKEHGVSRVLVEAGTGLVGALVDQGLAQEAWIFTAPRNGLPPHAAQEGAAPKTCVLRTLRPMQRLELVSHHMRGADEFARYLLPT